jgi:hypothetical protein
MIPGNTREARSMIPGNTREARSMIPGNTREARSMIPGNTREARSSVYDDTHDGTHDGTHDDIHDDVYAATNIKSMAKCRHHVCKHNTPIGQHSVQSIMRAATQSSLSAFHSAGMISNTGSAVAPSIREIMDNVRKSPSSMTFEFYSGTNIYDILRCRPMLVQVMIKAVMTNITTHRSSDIANDPDLPWMRPQRGYPNTDDTILGYSSYSSPCLSLYSRVVTLPRASLLLATALDRPIVFDKTLVSKGSSKGSSKGYSQQWLRHSAMRELWTTIDNHDVDNVTRDYIDIHLSYTLLTMNGISTSMIAHTLHESVIMRDVRNIMYIGEPICVVRIVKRHNSERTLRSIHWTILNTYIGTKTNITSIRFMMTDNDNVSAVTHGSDINAVARTPNVNIGTITTNSISDIETTFGIDAARVEIYRQLSTLHTDHKSCLIIANTMSRSGMIRGFTKHESEFTDANSPLFLGIFTSMYIERPKNDIRSAIVSEAYDDISCPYSRSMIGEILHLLEHTS